MPDPSPSAKTCPASVIDSESDDLVVKTVTVKLMHDDVQLEFVDYALFTTPICLLSNKTVK